ncbi:MAG: AAA family ATPase [Proteobacteria bacterium]|jgi:DNA polymerase-3 subunit delta'|nr:AAA family ATPase [Pseudomonadota bacterium]
MARILSSVLEHENNVESFLNAKQAGRLPQSFLLVGPTGVGKKKVALGFAQSLLCERQERMACGECGQCSRVAALRSESVLILAPEKNGYKVDVIRELLESLSLRNIRQARIVIIDQAEKLGAQASNSLLKTIEEPPPGVYFFLLTLSPHHVLSTIRSRCQIMKFQPLSTTSLKKLKTAPEWALRSAQGSMEKLNQLGDKEELKARTMAIDLLQQWPSGRPLFLTPEVRDFFRDREDSLSWCKHMAGLLRDWALFQMGHPEKVWNTDQLKVLETLPSISPEVILSQAERCLKLEKDYQAYRDPQLVFEQFWVTTRADLC